jgi:peptidoglycan/xylan/chitin deacetylase (PgdA/CDA1 family)
MTVREQIGEWVPEEPCAGNKHGGKQNAVQNRVGEQPRAGRVFATGEVHNSHRQTESRHGQPHTARGHHDPEKTAIGRSEPVREQHGRSEANGKTAEATEDVEGDGTREHVLKRVEGEEGLALGPPWLYPLKTAMTRGRSVAWVVRRRDGAAPGSRILFYHRISDDTDVLAVKPRAFAAQMAFLAEHGFRGIDVAQLGRHLAEGGDDPSLVGISFDDGYLDVAERAAPVLDRYGFTASVFVATAVTSGEATFSWYERQPPLIPWEQVVELDRNSPLRFEAHTRTHPNLLRVDDARAREEIAGGKHELEERLGRTVDAFCYPAGLFGARERGIVAEAGFRTAVSCEPGTNTPRTDPLALHRIQVDATDRLIDIRAKEGGGHDTAPRARAAWRRLRHGAA